MITCRLANLIPTLMTTSIKSDCRLNMFARTLLQIVERRVNINKNILLKKKLV